MDGHIHISFLRPICANDPFVDIDELEIEHDERSHHPDKPEEDLGSEQKP